MAVQFPQCTVTYNETNSQGVTYFNLTKRCEEMVKNLGIIGKLDKVLITWRIDGKPPQYFKAHPDADINRVIQCVQTSLTPKECGIK